MRIAIIGTGGVGAYLGARLAHIGNEVCFIARGTHLAAMRDHGLTLESELGRVELPEIEAYGDQDDIPAVDIALSCVKLYDAENAAALCKRILQPTGLAVSMQNGIDGPEFLRRALGETRTLTGSIKISCHIEAPGLVRHFGTLASLTLESREGLATTLYDECIKADVDTTRMENPEVILWRKFIRLAPISGMSVLCRTTFGTMSEDPLLRDVLQHLVQEAVDVALAKGIDLGDFSVNEVIARIKDSPADAKASLLVDLERGKRLESPWLSGRIVELGDELGVETPYHRAAYAAARPYLTPE